MMVLLLPAGTRPGRDRTGQDTRERELSGRGRDIDVNNQSPFKDPAR